MATIKQPKRKTTGKKGGTSNKGKKSATPKRKPVKRTNSRKRAYGVSGLETYFAHEFLDRLGLKYVYEYEAKDIGRFYDFAIVATAPDEELILEEKNNVRSVSQSKNTVRPILIIEVDGNYWHPDPEKVKWEDLTPTQKHNMFVDRIKNEWCMKRKIPILRVWETDIKKDPAGVMKRIKDAISRLETLDKIKAGLNKPHPRKR